MKCLSEKLLIDISIIQFSLRNSFTSSIVQAAINIIGIFYREFNSKRKELFLFPNFNQLIYQLRLFFCPRPSGHLCSKKLRPCINEDSNTFLLLFLFPANLGHFNRINKHNNDDVATETAKCTENYGSWYFWLCKITMAWPLEDKQKFE